MLAIRKRHALTVKPHQLPILQRPPAQVARHIRGYPRAVRIALPDVHVPAGLFDDPGG